ncbi:MAG: hypothetical protein M3Y27_17665 [Acidobacteriota bacterium]|nr:hypothetical protein [Acidobacteriota bacterium]
MRQLGWVVLTSLLGTFGFVHSAWAQGRGQGNTYSSVGGFGNVLYPGTGHAPVLPPGGLNGPSFAHRLGQNIGGSGWNHQPFRAGSNRTLVVPFPVYYGPMYGGYGSQYQDSPPPQYQEPPPQFINTNTSPSVVINQTFVPERAMPAMREYSNQPDRDPEPQQGMRRYEGPQSGPMPERARSASKSSANTDGQPTLYLIAFKDNGIVQALGYWVEDGNLHYVSAGHTLNQVSLDLVDRELSQRLNDERSVEFKLPR